MGGRLDLGPPTPFPSSSWFCFPGLPPPSWASSPIPLQPGLPGKPGTGESTGLGLPPWAQPLPQGWVPGWEVGAPLLALSQCGGESWSWEEAAGAHTLKLRQAGGAPCPTGEP